MTRLTSIDGFSSERSTILVGHPQAAARAQLERLLSERYEVLGGHGDGLELLQDAVRLQPDLVVLHARMPEIEGREIVEELHTLSPRSRCVVVTSPTDRQITEECVDAGAARVLRSPVTPARLLRGVADTLDRNGLQSRVSPEQGQRWVLHSPRDRGELSALSISLSHQLAESGDRVLIVDLDVLFGDLPRHLDLPSCRPDVLDLFVGVRHGGDAPLPFHQLDGRRWVALPPLTREVASGLSPAEVLPVVEGLQEQFDHVLLQLPPGDPRPWAELLAGADQVLSVTGSALHELRSMARIGDMFDAVGVPKQAVARVVVEDQGPITPSRQREVGLREFHALPWDRPAAEEAEARRMARTEVAPLRPYARALSRLLHRLRGTQGRELLAA